jgi:4-amino-4-deoxy-L-arabinose transferase-like glycosyltransferase
MATAQVSSILQETQTWDEGIYLAAGYSYLKTGDFRFDSEHPPLGKLINALPLLLLNPSLPGDSPGWGVGEQVPYGIRFLYQNRVPADRMLFLARSMTILLTLALGLGLAIWTRRHFGASAALFALFLFCFDPNIIAHGRYVTNDLVVTLFIFLSCTTWAAFLVSGRGRDLVWAGLALGLALASKFSALSLLALLPLLYLIRWWQERGRLSLRHLAVSLVVVTGISALVVMALYKMPPHSQPLEQLVSRTTLVERAIAAAGRHLGVPAHPYLVGLGYQARHYSGGHNAYLLGQYSDRGWWYYFPVAFAVKTPLAVLALMALCGWLVAPQLGRITRLRQAGFPWVVVTVPMVFVFLASLTSRLNTGLRYILPVYPFLFILLGGILFRFGRDRLKKLFPMAVGLGLVTLAVESMKIYPHYLAFFNAAAGGSATGPRYLLDSNIDWGQDMKKLKAYMVSHDLPYVCAVLFGNASSQYYGVDWKPVPKTDDLEGRTNMDCVVAANVTPLYGLYVPQEDYRWLRELQPAERIGYSIYLYDLREKR